MTVDPNNPTGTTAGEPTGTTGKPADGSGAAAGGSGAGKSNEELLALLEAAQKERDDEKRKNEQLLSEKTGVEREREELRQRAGAGGGSAPPTPQGPQDPELAEILDKHTKVKQVLSAYPGDPIAEAQELQLRLAYQARTRELVTTTVQQEIRAKVPPALQQKVYEKCMSGAFNTVDAAHDAVKRENDGAEVTTLRKEKEALEAELKRAKEQSPTFDVNTSIQGGSAPGAKKRYSGAEWAQLNKSIAPAEQAKLVAQLDKGEIEVVG